MLIFRDYEDRPIRLSGERMAHILSHPEMAGPSGDIGGVLAEPEVVVSSRRDVSVRLHYRRIRSTLVGEKLLCVVVKVVAEDAFVLTAYLTDRIKRGTKLWPTGE